MDSNTVLLNELVQQTRLNERVTIITEIQALATEAGHRGYDMRATILTNLASDMITATRKNNAELLDRAKRIAQGGSFNL